MSRRKASKPSAKKPEPGTGPEAPKPDAFNPIAVIKRMGAMPGLFISVGLLVTFFKEQLKPGADSPLAPWFDLIAAGLFVIGIFWWLVRIFAKLFRKRPARGLIDGLGAGILAGIIGGFLGYGWPDTSLYPSASPNDFFTVDSSPRYVRVFLAFIFCVPISGALGAGLDLVHTDRNIAWKKNLGIVLLVVLVFLLLIGFGLFAYIPGVTSMGIRFSDILALFDWFLLLYPALVFVSFGWPRHKIISRLLLIIAGILVLRTITYLLPTTDESSAFQATILNQVSWPNTTSYWWRTYWMEETRDASNGNNSALMGLTVVLLCVWSLILYAFSYRTHRLTSWMDRHTRRILTRFQL